jgi:hypothetical protein
MALNQVLFHYKFVMSQKGSVQSGKAWVSLRREVLVSHS